MVLESTEMFVNILNRNAKQMESEKKCSKVGQTVFSVAPNYVSRSAMPNNQFFILGLTYRSRFEMFNRYRSVQIDFQKSFPMTKVDKK